MAPACGKYGVLHCSVECCGASSTSAEENSTMRIFTIGVIAFATLVSTAAVAQVNLLSGCQAGFRACWDIGYYLDEETARRHRSRCTLILNGCQAQVRLAAAGEPYLDSCLYPRLSGYVYIDRNGQSTLILRRGTQP
jgi:hypothetical protein